MTGPTDASIVHTVDRIAYATEEMRTLLGLSEHDQLTDRSLTDFIAAENQAALTDQFERLRAHETDKLGLTLRLDRADGELREVISLSSCIEWDGTDQICTRFFDLDGKLPSGLTADTFDATPVGISIADATSEDDPLVYVNDRFVELTGYDREDVLGQNCRFLQGPNTDESTVAEIRAALDAEEPITVELQNYRRDGSMFWNRLSITPVTNETGETPYFLGFQEDISTQKLYEHEKTLFEMEAEAAEQVIFITDAEGTIEYVNPEFERVTGYTADEAVGKTPRLLKSDKQDGSFYRDLWETITASEVWEETITNKRKSGERYRTTQKIVPVTDPSGEITHFVSIEDEVTDAEFVEQVLDVMNRVLRHNVRNSVGVIDGYADLLERDLTEPEHKTAVRAIRKHAAELAKLSTETRTIRELFRRRNRQHTLAVGAIEGFVNRHRQEYPEATIRLELAVGETVEIPNGSLLELAIHEAIENAIVHNDQERPEVVVSVSRASDTAELVVRIADNGPGIPEDEWGVVESGRETALSHGSGIGLWLMYWTMTALGGVMERADNTPRGSVITYRIPLYET